MRSTSRHKLILAFAFICLIILVQSEKTEDHSQTGEGASHEGSAAIKGKANDLPHESEASEASNGDKNTEEKKEEAKEEGTGKLELSEGKANDKDEGKQKEEISTKDKPTSPTKDETKQTEKSSKEKPSKEKPSIEKPPNKTPPTEKPTMEKPPTQKSPVENTKEETKPKEETDKSNSENGKIEKPPVVVKASNQPPTESTNSSTEASGEENKTDCVTPAIEQFPRPLMGPSVRKHGGLILHISVAVFTFLGLAIVCDDYFVASLDRICEELKMSPDVAGATFMAAGSSAPELATVIIGVFFAHDDIGISGVIGSAVFNVMFVVSVCALCSATAIYLNWWPLIRDSFFYTISILAMLFTLYSGTISWGEALFMLFLYAVYCVALSFNTQLESWAQSLPVPCKKPDPGENASLKNYRTLEEEGKYTNYGCTEEMVEQGFDGPSLNKQADTFPQPAPAQQDYYRPRDPNTIETVNPLLKPENAGLYRRIKWFITYPIHFMCLKTIPDCRTERYKNWYAFTFFMAMIWISFYSYLMVWMITIIGATLGIPDTVMGLTFVAAGVSVPDVLSSVAVLKEGYGDMAVSNAIGSNVFDILICLGVPWFIKTAIINPGTEVKVTSKGLTYSTLSLLSTVVFLIVATHLNGWKLDRKFGIILLIWYLIFITFASMYELNVFGEMNPPECPSDY